MRALSLYLYLVSVETLLSFGGFLASGEIPCCRHFLAKHPQKGSSPEKFSGCWMLQLGLQAAGVGREMAVEGGIPGGRLPVHKEDASGQNSRLRHGDDKSVSLHWTQSCVRGHLLLLQVVAVCTFKDPFGHLVQDYIVSLPAPTFSNQTTSLFTGSFPAAAPTPGFLPSVRRSFGIWLYLGKELRQKTSLLLFYSEE